MYDSVYRFEGLIAFKATIEVSLHIFGDKFEDQVQLTEMQR